jgi:hypothetical protein
VILCLSVVYESHKYSTKGKTMQKNKLIMVFALFGVCMLSIFGIMTDVFALNVELLSTTPAPVQSGAYADVTIRITNPIQSDRTVESVIYGVEQTTFITPLKPEGENVGRMTSGTSITRTFRIFISESLPQGTISVPIFVKFDNSLSRTDVPLFIRKGAILPDLRIGKIESTPKQLIADSNDNKLRVVLQNLGETDAQLVSATLVVDKAYASPSYSYSFIDSVSQIAEGGQEVLEFYIDIEKNMSGRIPAKLDVSYRAKRSVSEEYQTYNKIIPISIDLIDSPYLVITSVEQQSAFESGSAENRVRLTLQNQGTGEAKEVRVRVIPDISYPFSFEETTQYVAAKLQPGQSTTIEFKTEVLSSAQEREYQINARIQSLIGETRYSRDDVFVISVVEKNSMSVMQIGMIAILFVVLLSFVFGYYNWKKKE